MTPPEQATPEHALPDPASAERQPDLTGLVTASWSGGLVVASAPAEISAYAAALVPMAACRLTQRLFGYEAQLSAFAAALRDGGCSPFFTPAPELFSTTESYRHLAYLAGVEGRLPGVIHVRFGMASHVRLLKNAENLVVLAERHVCRPVRPTLHPFGAGDWLPAGVSRVLMYDGLQSGASRLGGESVPIDLLSPDYITVDIEQALEGARAAEPDTLAERGRHGLRLASLAEYDPLTWGDQPSDGGASRDWRGVLAGAAQQAGFIMVPWNLGHPASIIPDLVLKLCRSAGLRADCAVVLFPYNATPFGLRPLSDLLLRLRDRLAGATLPLRRVFIGRLHSLDAVSRLPALFRLAWLEAGDPEWRWNRARLAALGIRAAVIGGAEEGPDLAFSAGSDETLEITVSDQFGDRLYVVPTLSVRGLAALAARSAATMRVLGPPAPVPMAAPADPLLLQA